MYFSSTTRLSPNSAPACSLKLSDEPAASPCNMQSSLWAMQMDQSPCLDANPFQHRASRNKDGHVYPSASPDVEKQKLVDEENNKRVWLQWSQTGVWRDDLLPRRGGTLKPAPKDRYGFPIYRGCAEDYLQTASKLSFRQTVESFSDSESASMEPSVATDFPTHDSQHDTLPLWTVDTPHAEHFTSGSAVNNAEETDIPADVDAIVNDIDASLQADISRSGLWVCSPTSTDYLYNESKEEWMELVIMRNDYAYGDPLSTIAESYSSFEEGWSISDDQRIRAEVERMSSRDGSLLSSSSFGKTPGAARFNRPLDFDTLRQSFDLSMIPPNQVDEKSQPADFFKGPDWSITSELRIPTRPSPASCPDHEQLSNVKGASSHSLPARVVAFVPPDLVLQAPRPIHTNSVPLWVDLALEPAFAAISQLHLELVFPSPSSRPKSDPPENYPGRRVFQSAPTRLHLDAKSHDHHAGNGWLEQVACSDDYRVCAPFFEGLQQEFACCPPHSLQEHRTKIGSPIDAASNARRGQRGLDHSLMPAVIDQLAYARLSPGITWHRDPLVAWGELLTKCSPPSADTASTIPSSAVSCSHTCDKFPQARLTPAPLLLRRQNPILAMYTVPGSLPNSASETSTPPTKSFNPVPAARTPLSFTPCNDSFTPLLGRVPKIENVIREQLLPDALLPAIAGSMTARPVQQPLSPSANAQSLSPLLRLVDELEGIIKMELQMPEVEARRKRRAERHARTFVFGFATAMAVMGITSGIGERSQMIPLSPD